MAVKFVQQAGDNRLYAGDAGPGRLLLILPNGYQYSSIDFARAWSDSTLNGTFVYAAGPIGETATSAGDFVAAVLGRVAAAGASRAYVWLADPAAWQVGRGGLTAANAPLLGLNADGTAATTPLDAPIVTGVALSVANGSRLVLGENLGQNTVRINGTVQFTGPHAPTGPAAPGADLGCEQGTVGLLSFDYSASRDTLLNQTSWGFQYVTADGYEWFALADGGAQAIRFAAAIDPSDPINTWSRTATPPFRSRLAFTGKDENNAQTILHTPFRTRQGAPVILYIRSTTAALVFNPGSGHAGQGGAMQLAPSGDFELGAKNSPDPSDLLCGLQGTEIIRMHPATTSHEGDILRFTPYQPAHAPRFPFPDASPLTAPVAATPALLDAAHTTSWATVVSTRNEAIQYVAQPDGSALYGQGDPIWNLGSRLMGWKTPFDPVSAQTAFPLLPYAATGVLRAGTLSPAATEDFEREILSPTRRHRIPAGIGSGTDAYTTVTSSGLLATVKGGKWTQIQLAQTPPLGLYFCNPAPELQQAFQSGDLFLVAANHDKLGTLFRGENNQCQGAQAGFANTVDIGGWVLAANVGTRNHYADYSNVLIIKGRKGKLYDPADPAAGLFSNPERWTSPATFAAPTDLVNNPKPPPAQVPGIADPAETVVLAQWLKDYFAAAWKAGDPDLEGFRRIATDENWTGILVLRADIAAVPADLVGITAGVGDPAGFHAHHLGVAITPVSTSPGPVPGPTLSGTSSLFGLIDYQDPAFTPPEAGQPARAVKPTTGQDYDFRLLSLKVVFANSAVSTFHSYAQLTATSWFDTRVDRMGGGSNPYRAIVLEGTLQSDDGQPVYNLAADAATTDTVFVFDHDVLAKLEITGAVMSTRDTGRHDSGDTLARSWFGLTGFLDFKVPRVPDAGLPDGEYPFDVFSFGAELDESAEPAETIEPTVSAESTQPTQSAEPRRGLAFSNLGILMTFPPDQPASSTLTLEAGETRFDTVTSTARPGSLFRQFALDVAGLRSGTAETPPQSAGFTSVATSARLTGVDGERWWGVEYRLPLGTPGNLAGRAGLSARLLTAWAADPDQGARPIQPPTRQDVRSYRAAVALSLPGSDGGAKLIGLQNVLKLSVGHIRLLYDTGPGSFLLLFSEIALKLYGLLSIPPGSTLFSLFGDPAGGGDPSGLGWYAMYRKDDGGAS